MNYPILSYSNPMSPNEFKLEFRAPPPSPIAAPRSVSNEQILSNYLDNTLRVPDLILPDHIFSKPKPSTEDIPVVDFHSILLQTGKEVVMNSLLNIGCFQLINHGIETDSMELAMKRAAEVFQLSLEKKAAVMKTTEMGCGFEELMISNGTKEQFDDDNMVEEFIWCSRDEELRLKMDRVWPVGYPRFRGEMESLSREIESILRTILLSMRQDDESNSQQQLLLSKNNDDGSSSVCYIYKNNIPPPTAAASDGQISTLKHDVIRMMIKGSSHYSHALSLHICGKGCNQFQVYSKKGFLSFVPCDENVLIVTSGDQAQTWTGRPCKSVRGRSIYAKKKQDRDNQFIAMTFHYTPCLKFANTSISSATSATAIFQQEQDGLKIVTLRQQALFAIFVTISCQLSLHIYRQFCVLFSS